jgi:hypothetical protein
MVTDRIHVLPIALGVASAGPFSGASWDQDRFRAEVVSDRRLKFLGVNKRLPVEVGPHWMCGLCFVL